MLEYITQFNSLVSFTILLWLPENLKLCILGHLSLIPPEPGQLKLCFCSTSFIPDLSFSFS